MRRKAAKELRHVPKRERLRIIHDGLRENPLRGSVLKGNLRGLRRVAGGGRLSGGVRRTAYGVGGLGRTYCPSPVCLRPLSWRDQGIE